MEKTYTIHTNNNPQSEIIITSDFVPRRGDYLIWRDVRGTLGGYVDFTLIDTTNTKIQVYVLENT
jgi:hypothetical protein